MPVGISVMTLKHDGGVHRLAHMIIQTSTEHLPIQHNAFSRDIVIFFVLLRWLLRRKKQKRKISDVACSYFALLSLVISLAYQVQQFNMNFKTDYSDLFT